MYQVILSLVILKKKQIKKNFVSYCRLNGIHYILLLRQLKCV